MWRVYIWNVIRISFLLKKIDTLVGLIQNNLLVLKYIMDFRNIKFFDNNDSINLYYYLLNFGFNTEQVKLKSCIKWDNRINIEIHFNNYKTIICPALTTYHWFSVSRKSIIDTKELNGNDVLEFSANKEDFHKIFSFIHGHENISNVANTIKKIKKDISEISEKFKNNKFINDCE